jgi:hypothetical protein
VHNQAEHEADYEHPEQHFRDFTKRGDGIAYAEERNNQSRNYKCKSPTQHNASTIGRSPAQVVTYLGILPDETT